MSSKSIASLFLIALLSIPISGRLPLSLKPIEKPDDSDAHKFKELLEKDCQRDVLKAFGLKLGNDITKGRMATQTELDYCRKNRVTCCSAAEIESVVPSFQAAHQKVRSLLEPIEELATLFRGPKFDEEILQPLVRNVQDVDAKKDVAKEACYERAKLPNGVEFNFSLEHPETRALYREMLDMIPELDYYEKRVNWFYGDILCSLCNAADQEYLSIKDKKVSFAAHTSTCAELFDMKEFELRLAMIYVRFLRPIANTHKCINQDSNKPVKEEDYLPAMDAKALGEKYDAYEACSGEFDPNGKHCKEFCEVNLASFTFAPDVLNNFYAGLSAFFPPLTDMDVEDFYKFRKGMDYPNDVKGVASYFEAAGAEVTLEISYAEKGINVFNNHWTKKYLEFKAPVKIVIAE